MDTAIYIFCRSHPVRYSHTVRLFGKGLNGGYDLVFVV